MSSTQTEKQLTPVNANSISLHKQKENQLTSRSSSPSSSSTSSSPASKGVDKADALVERPLRSFRSLISSNFDSAALWHLNRAIWIEKQVE